MSLSLLSQLLPLPDEELKQVLDYAASLSKTEAADHLGNLLGDSPRAIEFISSFNSRRQTRDARPSPLSAATPEPSSSANNSDVPSDGVPKPKRGRNKNPKKAPIHSLAPRKVEDTAPPPGVSYNKKGQEEDYYIGRKPSPASTPSTSVNAGARHPAPSSATPPPQTLRTAAGYLISDGPTAKAKSKSTPTSRSSTPKPSSNANTKISIAGGTPMAGASTALSGLDAAIRALEMTTNPTLQEDPKTRRCNCVATRHDLQTAAPNCLSCGKIVCLKEGLGPCTFCGTPLLSSTEVQAMVTELRAEKGREKMAADREAHKRPEVSKKPAPFSQFRNQTAAAAAASAASSHSDNGGTLTEAETKAREHRDKLLGYQAQNARRTTVRDEAADFDVSGAMSGSGASIWSTPEERAKELKRQQKVLQEMEWNARPEYEKRRQIVSIDLVGGRVVKKMAAVDRPVLPEDEVVDEGDVDDGGVVDENLEPSNRNVGGGTFSKNPLLGGLIKPVYATKGEELEGRRDRKTQWRRVQDDANDNEGIILDGGSLGFAATADGPA